MSGIDELMVVTGAGPVGWTVAEQLAEQGRRVRVLTRSGSGPEHPLVERRAVDVRDERALTEAAQGASAIFHAIHGSAYSERSWRAELPEADRVVLAAAGANDAVAVFPESLYSYTDTARVMTEDGPRDWPSGKGRVRVELLAARAASATPTVSVVASDFYGPRVRTSHMGERVVPQLLAGRKVRVLGSLDQPHSWTYVPDLARAMVAAAQDRSLWNAVLHAPTAPPLTQRQMVHALAAAAGLEVGADVPEPGLVPSWAMRGLGAVAPSMRELAQMLYQFEQPFVMDSAASEARLGFGPTSIEDGAAATVAWWSGVGQKTAAA